MITPLVDLLGKLDGILQIPDRIPIPGLGEIRPAPQPTWYHSARSAAPPCLRPVHIYMAMPSIYHVNQWPRKK